MEWVDARKWISLLEDKEDKALMNPVEGRKAKDKSPDEEMSPSKEKFMNLEL